MPSKHELTAGISTQMLEEGRAPLEYADEEPVIILRIASSIEAFRATCSHLHGPLQDRLLDGTQVICPWHHAYFDLRTGQTLTAPAFNSLERDDVGQRRQGRHRQSQPDEGEGALRSHRPGRKR